MTDMSTSPRDIPLGVVTHTPAPPEVNSLPALIDRLTEHAAKWGKGITPIDSEDLQKLLAAARMHALGSPGATKAADLTPPAKAQS
jgi:hypothetical protein